LAMLTTRNGDIEPAVAELDLDRIVWKVTNNPFKPEMSENDVLNAVQQYRRFLTLKIRYPSAQLVPTDDIDLIWHAHILDTENYQLDCNSLFGRFMHHSPFFGEYGDESQEQMNDLFNITSTLWMKEFGENLESPNIFRCKGKACHVTTNCRCR